MARRNSQSRLMPGGNEGSFLLAWAAPMPPLGRRNKAMAKKKSAKGETSKKAKAPVSEAAAAKPEAQAPAPKPVIRAIRVSQELLDAAKAYKKATGTSFYTLGFEAISDRLKREGYLKTAEAGTGA